MMGIKNGGGRDIIWQVYVNLNLKYADGELAVSETELSESEKVIDRREYLLSGDGEKDATGEKKKESLG